MKVSIIGTLWRINTRDDGKMSVNISESRKKQTGNYETMNSLWATVSEEAVDAINAVAAQLEDRHKPFMTFEGYMNGYGVKNADGTYGNGRFTITSAKPFQNSNGNGTVPDATPAAAPVPQAYTAPTPVSTPTPAPQNYANPVPGPMPAPAATSEMYAIPDDDDEELPFN